MAQLFKDETRYPDNRKRSNFIFFGYPYTPAIDREDYARVIRELESELPIRLWYFLDEVTTAELMRKIWRAILRADICVFDISRGNPNVAFELGLAVSQFKSCITILKTGEPNPLGSADLGYAERAEYSSVATLKDTLKRLIIAKSGAVRQAKEAVSQIYDSSWSVGKDEVEKGVIEILANVYRNKRITKTQAEKILNNRRIADLALSKLRELDILQIEGQKRGAKWVFSDSWVYSDHEVVGVA